MQKRQVDLLKRIIKIYIRTAEPVGSLCLADKFGGFSSATIRHEMTVLEEEGYICQPHISAGRVPTERGYKFYVEHCLGDGQIDKISSRRLSAAGRRERGEAKMKFLARAAAESAEEAIIAVFDRHHLYFTGLSYLFAKPEFSEQARVTSVSDILDHCDEVMPEILKLIDEKRKILIGSENPFGRMCSFVAASWGREGVFGLLGPMRMDYEKNLGIINYIAAALND